MQDLHAVIMAGGAGTRFWPASRAARPKQFLPLANGKPLIQAAVERMAGCCPADRVWIVTNPTQARLLPSVLPEFPAAQIIVEPEARDTAPCVALATATIQARDPSAILAMLPADHVITPENAFCSMVQRGAAIAADDQTLVTFGVEPTFAATGYGYIECAGPLDEHRPRARHVVRFREKPDKSTAEQFVAAGSFLWNSGIFVWSAAALRAAMRAGAPELLDCTDRMLAGLVQGDREAVVEAFTSAPKTSIDFAVMERAPRVAVVDATVRWNDVGSFPALEAIVPTDADGNAALLHDGAQHIALHSTNNTVYAEGQRTVALFGAENLVVVAVDDAVLVCPSDKADELKLLVAHVRQLGRADLL